MSEREGEDEQRVRTLAIQAAQDGVLLTLRCDHDGRKRRKGELVARFGKTRSCVGVGGIREPRRPDLIESNTHIRDQGVRGKCDLARGRNEWKRERGERGRDRENRGSPPL